MAHPGSKNPKSGPAFSQGDHVSIWYILGPQSRYMKNSLDPNYKLLFYIDPLGLEVAGGGSGPLGPPLQRIWVEDGAVAQIILPGAFQGPPRNCPGTSQKLLTIIFQGLVRLGGIQNKDDFVL